MNSKEKEYSYTEPSLEEVIENYIEFSKQSTTKPKGLKEILSENPSLLKKITYSELYSAPEVSDISLEEAFRHYEEFIQESKMHSKDINETDSNKVRIMQKEN